MSPARPNSTPWSPTCRASANTLRGEVEMVSGIVTALLLVVFLGGWAWAWSPRRRREFEEAA
ncbi:MAG TPA: cbb3-type cytochrome c oxidase subunit 3, partial [Roseateles sp.]|nr:cbb3-type cytochrome c oxidase subunit 3 [Roseateles sp.]